MRDLINLIENALSEEPIHISGRQLIKMFGDKACIVPFDDLPEMAKKSLHHWMMVDGENSRYRREKYGYLEIQTKAFMELLYDQMNDDPSVSKEEWVDDWMNDAGTLSSSYRYPKGSIWPVIWGYGFEDGSHRLDKYLKMKLPVIPVVICGPTRKLTEVVSNKKAEFNALMKNLVDAGWILPDGKILKIESGPWGHSGEYIHWLKSNDPAEYEELKDIDFHGGPVKETEIADKARERGWIRYVGGWMGDYVTFHYTKINAAQAKTCLRLLYPVRNTDLKIEISPNGVYTAKAVELASYNEAVEYFKSIARQG